jgi:hypothetical protein
MFKLLQSDRNSNGSWLLDGVGNERKQSEMSCTLDGHDQHPLVLRARTCNALRYDTALLRNEPLELLLGLVVNEIFLVVAEAARAFLPDLAGCAPL